MSDISISSHQIHLQPYIPTLVIIQSKYTTLVMVLMLSFSSAAVLSSFLLPCLDKGLHNTSHFHTKFHLRFWHSTELNASSSTKMPWSRCCTGPKPEMMKRNDRKDRECPRSLRSMAEPILEKKILFLCLGLSPEHCSSLEHNFEEKNIRSRILLRNIHYCAYRHPQGRSASMHQRGLKQHVVEDRVKKIEGNARMKVTM